jgi:hypothetical protein
LTWWTRLFWLAPRAIRFHADPHDLNNGQAHSRFGIFGIDSFPNFNDHFWRTPSDASGNPNRHWYINTIGNPPQMGGTTIHPDCPHQCGAG